MSNRCEHGMMSWECAECSPKRAWTEEEVNALLDRQVNACVDSITDWAHFVSDEAMTIVKVDVGNSRIKLSE